MVKPQARDHYAVGWAAEVEGGPSMRPIGHHSSRQPTLINNAGIGTAGPRQTLRPTSRHSPREIRRSAACLDVGDDAGSSLRITAMHQHARAGFPELACNEPADSVCRSAEGFELRFAVNYLAGFLLTLLLLPPSRRSSDDQSNFSAVRLGGHRCRHAVETRRLLSSGR